MSSDKPLTAKVPPPKTGTAKSPDLEKRRVIAQIIPNPISYIDLLCAREVVGNTPRPSKVKNLFFNGMRCLEKRPAQAEKHLKEAVQQAKTAISTQKTQKVPKIDIERMAYALMGLGYVLVIKGTIDMAEKCYKRSLMYWTKLHSKGLHLLIPLMTDLTILEILCNSESGLKLTNNILKINKNASKGSWVNAYSISRLASVASGQQGNELRLPLKDGQKRVVFPPKLINHAYKISTEYMQANVKGDSKDEQERSRKTKTALQFYQQYLKPKSKTSTTTATPSKTSTTITTTTTTETKESNTTKPSEPQQPEKEQQELVQGLSKKLDVSPKTDT